MNIYKKTGVFKCRHPAHAQFNYEISPYHALKINRCWPDGCVEFLWRCRLFDKGHKCPRKFKHIGRSCASCKYYYEIKNCYAPSTNLDDSEFREFLREFGEYEGWLESMMNKTIRFSGLIVSVRPHLTMRIDRKKRTLRMDDLYVSFDGGYLNNQLFDSRIYLRISRGFLERTRIARGDEIECDAVFSVDKGRVILRSPRRIDLTKNGGKQSLTPSNATVGRATGRIIEGSISYCRDCPYCCLVDIYDESRLKAASYRRFYCLRGITNPEYCPVRLNILGEVTFEKGEVRRF